MTARLLLCALLALTVCGCKSEGHREWWHEVLTCVNRETGVETFSIATDDGEAFYWEKGMFWWNERDGKFDTYRPAAVEGCISYRQDTGS